MQPIHMSMSSPSTLGVCVIGTGRAGMIHARNLASGRVRNAALVALVDPDEECRRGASAELPAARSYVDFREALADLRVDAVVVATPTTRHCEIAVASAGAGKHVFCEKPMAMTAGECDEMIGAAESAGITLQIGFMRRFDAGFVAAKERIESGEIGGVVQVKSLTHGPSTPQPWMYDLHHSNGPLAEVNSHDIDTVRWLAGSEFQEVYAIAGNYRCPDARPEHPDFYDNVILTARLESGAQAVITGAQGVQYGYDARCEVLGEKGLLTIGGLLATSTVAHTPKGMFAPLVRSWSDLFRQAYEAELQDFADCIRTECRPRADGRDGKAAVMVVNAGNRSIREKRPVLLSEEGATR